MLSMTCSTTCGGRSRAAGFNAVTAMKGSGRRQGGPGSAGSAAVLRAASPVQSACRYRGRPGPRKGRDAVGRDVVEQRDRRQIGVVLVQGNLLIEPRQASTVMPMISSSRSAGGPSAVLARPAPAARAISRSATMWPRARPTTTGRRAARIALPHGAQDGRGVFVDQAEHEDVDRTGKGGVVKTLITVAAVNSMAITAPSADCQRSQPRCSRGRRRSPGRPAAAPKRRWRRP